LPKQFVLCDSGTEDSVHIYFFLCQNSVQCLQHTRLWNQVGQVLNYDNSIAVNIFDILQT